MQGKAEKAMEVFSMLNPIRRAGTRADAQRYKVEPYAVAADVYGEAPHVGRGGWTWYTGSAGWMYRLAVESLLGLRREGDKLRIVPCLPASWPGFKLSYRYGETLYRIEVVRDKNGGAEHVIPLLDDGREHRVDVRIR